METQSIITPWATNLERRLARSRRVARGAALLRNRCDRVIGYHFAATSDPNANGERWLVERVATAVHRFVDVGANVGDWTAMLLSSNPHARGLAVEPGLEALRRLRARVPASVEVVAAAAGADESGMTFYEQPGAGTRSSSIEGWAGTSRRRDVESVTVDGLLARIGWPTIDFLKVDTEGYDANVLAGARQALRARRIELVQFEYNRPWRHTGHTLAGVTGALEAAGYDVFVLRSAGLERYDYAVFGEFFNYANFVALSPSSAVRHALGLP